VSTSSANPAVRRPQDEISDGVIPDFRDPSDTPGLRILGPQDLGLGEGELAKWTHIQP
jgi:hypothetical protein